MRGWLAAITLMVLGWTTPTLAQRNEPSVGAVEAVLADVGQWMLEYSSILSAAGDAMGEVDAFVGILDRFTAGDAGVAATSARIDAWRANALTRVNAIRADSAALRDPPSLALLGTQGEGLNAALATAKAGVAPLLDEVAAMIDSMAAMGGDAIEHPEKGIEVRLRAVYGSALAMIRIDLRRIDANFAALSPDHPNRPLMRANQILYAALMLFPQHELDDLDGRMPDAMRVARALRLAAADMRVQTAQGLELAERMRQALRTSPAPPGGENLVRMVLELIATFPETARAYDGLAASLEAGAAAIEAGATVDEAAERQVETATPHLREIERLEHVRANLAATIGRRGGV